MPGRAFRRELQLAKDQARLDKVNKTIGDQGFQYSGKTKVKHLLWMLFEDIGIDRIKGAIRRKFTGLKIAPFYGCYILRPAEYLGLVERPERKTYLEQLIGLVGATPVEYSGSTKCCGFPMLTFNRDKSLTMAGNHIMEAKDKGADRARYAVPALPSEPGRPATRRCPRAEEGHRRSDLPSAAAARPCVRIGPAGTAFQPSRRADRWGARKGRAESLIRKHGPSRRAASF